MITEDYCSYELAKLLKEKEFDEICWRLYQIDEKELLGTDGIPFVNHEIDEDFIAVPTLSLACKWLREVKGIYINVRNTVIEPLYDRELHFAVDILDRGKGEWVDNDIWGNSYEEAVEAALKYSLENLI